MFEEIIRYHILCEHELCGSEATVSNHEGFSSHLNVEQMNKVRPGEKGLSDGCGFPAAAGRCQLHPGMLKLAWCDTGAHLAA
jgi:hypothetical protein